MKRITLILPLLAVAAACNQQKPVTAKSLTPVRVAPVEFYQPRGGGRYSASILPGRQVTLAFRVTGIIEGLYEGGGRRLEPGDMVPAGAVLARLREDDYRHTVAQAQSQLESAREQQ